MSNYIDNFNTDFSFWELYPEFKVIEPYKDLYKSDKNKTKKDSSIMMWFVAYCYSKASKFRNLAKDGIDGKHYVIGEDYCNDKNFYNKNKNLLDIIIDSFIDSQFTPLERHLMVWDDLLNKRTAYLKEQDYDFSTYEDLDKMAVGTSKVFETIKKIWEDLQKEEGSGIAKGGSVPSLND